MVRSTPCRLTRPHIRHQLLRSSLSFFPHPLYLDCLEGLVESIRLISSPRQERVTWTNVAQRFAPFSLVQDWYSPRRLSLAWSLELSSSRQIWSDVFWKRTVRWVELHRRRLLVVLFSRMTRRMKYALNVSIILTEAAVADPTLPPGEAMMGTSWIFNVF